MRASAGSSPWPFLLIWGPLRESGITGLGTGQIEGHKGGGLCRPHSSCVSSCFAEGRRQLTPRVSVHPPPMSWGPLFLLTPSPLSAPWNPQSHHLAEERGTGIGHRSPGLPKLPAQSVAARGQDAFPAGTSVVADGKPALGAARQPSRRSASIMRTLLLRNCVLVNV